MLQRKLLARLGLLMVGFVVGAVVSITLLQGVLRDLDAMNAEAAAVTDAGQDLGLAVSLIEADSVALHAGTEVSSIVIAEHITALRRTLDNFAGYPMIARSGDAANAFAQVRKQLSGVIKDSNVTGVDFAELRSSLNTLGQFARHEIITEQASLSRRLRTMIIGLTLAALVMVNISVFVLLRTAGMILKPVSQLLEGSRELAREHFGHRITVDQNDEFAELARAHNYLADELAANEQRKVQAMHHLAVTLSHELNNVINIIDLRLEIMSRISGTDPSLAAHMREIHENLRRMSRTIASLRNVRRIVLTDYLPGEKMLDLPRSVADEEPSDCTNPTSPATHMP